MKNRFNLKLRLLLLLMGYTIPTIATIELCRCTANFEQFYDSPHYNDDDDDHSKTSESIRYPYNYIDHYIDTHGFVIVEGIRVLSDRSTACARDLPNRDDDEDDDDDARGRSLLLTDGDDDDDSITTKETTAVVVGSNSQAPRRRLMGTKMGGKGTKNRSSVTNRHGKGSGKGSDDGDEHHERSGKGGVDNCATPQVPLPPIFVCPTHAAAVRDAPQTEPPTAVPITTESPSTRIATDAAVMCSCDDQNVCTVDSCDENQECLHTPVTCGNNEACDTIDGLCKDIDSLRPCIAVIDESDSFPDAEMNAKWSSFRRRFPTRPFCLLQPLEPTSSYLYFPTDPDFLTDPRSAFAVVNRDQGYPEYEMDWLHLCGYTDLAGSGIDFVSFFLDESGSMDRTTVGASLQKFTNDLSVANLTYCWVFDDTEDWITPFDTVLGSVGDGGACTAS